MTNSSTTKVPPLLVFLCLLSGTSPSTAVTADENDTQRPSSPQLAKRIRTLMCASESCDGADEGTSGCRAYTTPLNACYDARFLFPGDESWGDSDVFDEMIMGNIKRTFYRSGDGSCSGRGEGHNGDDSFILPLDECVGPFGPPRPWGKFTLLFDSGDRVEEVSATGRK